METFCRTFVMVLIMELGSASNFTLAAISSHSKSVLTVWIAGITAMIVAALIAVMLGDFLKRFNINQNLVSGVVMVTLGLYFLWRQ